MVYGTINNTHIFFFFLLQEIDMRDTVSRGGQGDNGL